MFIGYLLSFFLGVSLGYAVCMTFYCREIEKALDAKNVLPPQPISYFKKASPTRRKPKVHDDYHAWLAEKKSNDAPRV